MLGRSEEKHLGRHSKHKDRFSSQDNASSDCSQLSTNRLFDTKFIDSVANIHPSGLLNETSTLSEHVHNSSLLQLNQRLQE